MQRFNRSSFILVLFLLAASSAYASGIQKKVGNEMVQMNTDGRQWNLGFQHEAGPKGVVQYVLKDENSVHWSELITINYFTEVKPDMMNRLIDFTKKGLEGVCKKVQWNLISQKETRSLYEWSVSECKDMPDQSEVAVAILGKKGFYVLHYASKTVPMPAKDRNAWKIILETAKVL